MASNVHLVFRDGVLVTVHVSYWTGSIMLRAQDLGLDPMNVAETFHLGKKELVPAKIIQAFRKIEGRARALVNRDSFYFPIGNARFVPRRKFVKVLRELKKCEVEFNVLIDDIVENYEQYRQQMIPIYQKASETAYETMLIEAQRRTHETMPEGLQTKEEFTVEFMKNIEGHYPKAESLRKRFGLYWDVYEVAMPRMKMTAEEKVIQDQQEKEKAEQEAEENRRYYQEQVRQKMNSFIGDVVSSLRAEAIELCTKIVTNIKEGKVVKEGSLKKLGEFVDRFSDLNFVGDVKIEQELNKLRKEFLQPHSAEAIHTDEDLKAELSRRLNVLVEMASDVTDINSVTGEYHRKILWREETPTDVPVEA